jgi:DNA mismatch endonuclease (patch repair protein)
MPDNLSKEQRIYCMSQVKAKDTSLERRLRTELRWRGYRFRKHVMSLSGKPDIVFSKQCVAVLVDGDFWEGWRFPNWRGTLSTRWQTKIWTTRRRDQRNFHRLRAMGSRVVRIWEHQLMRDFTGAIERVAVAVDSRSTASSESVQTAYSRSMHLNPASRGRSVPYGSPTV